MSHHDEGPYLLIPAPLVPPVLRYEVVPHPSWPIDAVSIIAALGWAFCLVGDPHLMAQNPTYSMLVSTPQWIWAICSALIGCIQLVAALRNRWHRFARWSVVLAFAWWTAIGLLYLLHTPYALGGWVHLAIATGVLVRLWRW